MKVKGMMGSAVLCVVMGLLISGCAGGNYGTMKAVEGGGVTLDTLVRDWQSYNIFYGGTNPDRPIAVIFDPKSDGKTLEVEGRWWSASDEKTMRDVVGRVNMLQETVPRLWKILGPDDSLYGYAYTPLLRLNMTVVDQNTMRLISR